MKSLSSLFSLIAIFALTTFTTTNAQAQQKIAHVDSDAIIFEMPEYKVAKSNVETYSKVLKKLLEDEQAAIQQYYEEVSNKVQLGQMTPIEQKEAEKKLAEMQEALQANAAKSDQQLAEKEQTETKPLYDKFNAALEKVAQDNGYAYIFDIKLALYSGGGTDVTDLVKAELGI